MGGPKGGDIENMHEISISVKVTPYISIENGGIWIEFKSAVWRWYRR